MSNQDATFDLALPISAVERETGLSKDLLRKWEVRYNFPVPGRDAAGERVYPAEQVARLRLIKRLLDAGMRPSGVVGRNDTDLAALAEQKFGSSQQNKLEGFAGACLDTLRAHDAKTLRMLLLREMHREGLRAFVLDKLVFLIQQVGESWAHGELDIHEEHLFSEVAQNLLRGVSETLNPDQGRPRILLTTVPGEPHGLGLLMVAALATLECARCVSLGTQTPVKEIVDAARAGAADVVALSFSSAFPSRRLMPAIAPLRAGLPEHVAIWVGGEGTRRASSPDAGIEVLPDLRQLSDTLANWRGAHPG
jgi:methanogenic corrinoid protein MtbC1